MEDLPGPVGFQIVRSDMPLDEEKPLLERYPVFTAERWSLARFQEEQEYVLAKLRRHNQMLHGWGVVDGLEASLETSRGGDRVVLTPGYALDCQGNEVRVLSPVSLDLPDREGDGRLYLCLEYLEERVLGDPEDDGAPSEFAATREGFEVSLELEDPCEQHAGHRSDPLLRQGCGEHHSFPLARLVFSRIRWRVDLHFSVKRV
jgi:hypothetical protein